MKELIKELEKDRNNFYEKSSMKKYDEERNILQEYNEQKNGKVKKK